MENTLTNVICPYCGVSQMIEVPEDSTAKQLEEFAVRVCDCEQAKHEQRKLSVKEKIDMLFGAGSEANGFECPLDKKELKSITNLCAEVLDGRYINVVVTLPSGDKARITTVKDRIKVVREDKNQAETKI